MRRINKTLTLLITAVFLFSILAPVSATASAEESGSNGMSLFCGSGANYFICLPKENASEIDGAKHCIVFEMRQAELSVEKSERSCWVLPCFVTPNANKIIKVVYKKDGKK